MTILATGRLKPGCGCCEGCCKCTFSASITCYDNVTEEFCEPCCAVLTLPADCSGRAAYDVCLAPYDPPFCYPLKDEAIACEDAEKFVGCFPDTVECGGKTFYLVNVGASWSCCGTQITAEVSDPPSCFRMCWPTIQDCEGCTPECAINATAHYRRWAVECEIPNYGDLQDDPCGLRGYTWSGEASLNIAGVGWGPTPYPDPPGTGEMLVTGQCNSCWYNPAPCAPADPNLMDRMTMLAHENMFDNMFAACQANAQSMPFVASVDGATVCTFASAMVVGPYYTPQIDASEDGGLSMCADWVASCLCHSAIGIGKRIAYASIYIRVLPIVTNYVVKVFLYFNLMDATDLYADGLPLLMAGGGDPADYDEYYLPFWTETPQTSGSDTTTDCKEDPPGSGHYICVSPPREITGAWDIKDASRYQAASWMYCVYDDSHPTGYPWIRHVGQIPLGMEQTFYCADYGDNPEAMLDAMAGWINSLSGYAFFQVSGGHWKKAFQWSISGVEWSAGTA